MIDPKHIHDTTARYEALRDGWQGHDDLDPRVPSGHAYGLRVSTRLTSDYRRMYRKDAMDITPQDVVDCLVSAGVKNWVLMGLHGYVGYLPMPRATQDVDVMVPYSQKKRAIKAIEEQWPSLHKTELSQVVRFADPGDVDSEDQPKPVIDLMLPWSPFQETILQEHVVVDEATGIRLPMIEAAVISKYAALISPHRSIEKKEYDAGDLRRLIKANHKAIRIEVLRDLAGEVWEGGADEIERYLDAALNDQPFER